jgi:glycosyltransferase involved in cell wall biosynthesis
MPGACGSARAQCRPRCRGLRHRSERAHDRPHATTPESPAPRLPHRMKHAFAIPAYGDSPYLEGCLASLAAQTRQGSDIVIATSTPTDKLRAVASRWGVALRVNDRQRGIGDDWNFALAATDADMVTLAHQDDLYDPRYLDIMLGAMSRHDDAIIGFSNFREVTPAGPRAPHVNLRIKRLLCRRAFDGQEALRSPVARRRLFAWGNPVCCPSVVLRRSRTSDFRFVESMRSNLDWEAWSRLALEPGSFVYVPEPLVIRRIHPHSETTATIADHHRLAEDKAMFERFWPLPVARLISLVYRASYRANRS